MTINDLTAFVHEEPSSRWFYFVEKDGELEQVDEKPKNEKDLVLAYELDYVSKKRQRELMTSNASRRAIRRRGVKALQASDAEVRKNLCLESLRNWKVTPRGLFLLNAELDVSKLDENELIEFNEGNIVVLAERSDLGTDVYGILTEHEEWFEAASAGNSGDGPSSNMGKPPADPASTAT